MKHILLLLLFVPFVSFHPADLKPVDADDAVSFSIKNFGIGTRGTLGGLKGKILWQPENLAASSFAVSVEVNTINTGIDSRDSHLKKEEYFDAAKYPQIRFVSSAITKTATGYNVSGNLTIKATTRQVTIPFTVTPNGSGFLFQGDFTLNRKDYSVGGSSMVLGNDVKVSLKVNANP